MTRTVEDTPLTERTLLVQGRAADPNLLFGAGLPASLGVTDVALFLGYNYAEIPIGTHFDAVYTANREQNVRFDSSKIVAVTQQFAMPLDQIPHGWKTVTVLRFAGRVPDLIRALPELTDWDFQDRVLISSRETWEARMALAADPPSQMTLRDAH